MKRALVSLGLILVLLLTMAAAGCTSESKTSEKEAAPESSEEAAEKVDEKFEEVLGQLEAFDEAWYACGLDEMTGVLAASQDGLTDLRDVVEEARELAEEIPNDDIKDQYLEACDAFDAAIDESLAECATIMTYAEAYDVFIAAIAYDDAGDALVNEAIIAGNGNNYGGAEQKANEGAVQYQLLRDAFAQAASMSGLQQVSGATQYADSQLLVAQGYAELARIGARGGISSYNAQIAKCETQEAASATLFAEVERGEEALVDAVNGYSDFAAFAADAEDAWDEAMDMVNEEKREADSADEDE